MDVTLGLLADAANTTENGKLNVLGVFSKINPTAFPTQVPAMQIVLRFEADSVERGERKALEIRLVDQDGGELLKVEGNLDIPAEAPGGAPVEMQTIIGLAGVTFQRPGPHAFVVMVTGARPLRIPLNVSDVGEPAVESKEGA